MSAASDVLMEKRGINTFCTLTKRSRLDRIYMYKVKIEQLDLYMNNATD